MKKNNKNNDDLNNKYYDDLNNKYYKIYIFN